MKAKDVNVKTNDDRRRLLAGLTAFAGFAVTGVALSGDAPHDDQPKRTSDEPQQDCGYRETNHVRAYYSCVRDL